jgi:hypothetical protein
MPAHLSLPTTILEALEEDGPLDGMNFQTCMNYGSVARAKEPPDVGRFFPFTHHREVAARLAALTGPTQGAPGSE